MWCASLKLASNDRQNQSPAEEVVTFIAGMIGKISPQLRSCNIYSRNDRQTPSPAEEVATVRAGMIGKISVQLRKLQYLEQDTFYTIGGK